MGRIPSVPENVTDQVRICNNNVLNIRFAVSFKSTLTSACTQIRLWESDLNRVIMKPAHFIEDFSSRVCISYSFFLNEYIYIYILRLWMLMNLAGRIWCCMRLCTRMQRFIMGKFQKNASCGEWRNFSQCERLYSSASAVTTRIQKENVISDAGVLDRITVFSFPNYTFYVLLNNYFSDPLL